MTRTYVSILDSSDGGKKNFNHFFWLNENRLLTIQKNFIFFVISRRSFYEWNDLKNIVFHRDYKSFSKTIFNQYLPVSWFWIPNSIKKQKFRVGYCNQWIQDFEKKSLFWNKKQIFIIFFIFMNIKQFCYSSHYNFKTALFFCLDGIAKKLKKHFSWPLEPMIPKSRTLPSYLLLVS